MTKDSNKNDIEHKISILYEKLLANLDDGELSNLNPEQTIKYLTLLAKSVPFLNKMSARTKSETKDISKYIRILQNEEMMIKLQTIFDYLYDDNNRLF